MGPDEDGALGLPELSPSQKAWNHDCVTLGKTQPLLHLTFLVLQMDVMMLSPGVLMRIQKTEGGRGFRQYLRVIHIPLVTKP